jgi:epoxide hydrolase-like predicted phosphatase
MIKAIIFDYFGVIFSDDYWRVVREDKNLGGSFHDLSNQVNLGEITWHEFVGTLSKKTGTPVSKINEMYEAERIDRRMVAYIAELHKNYKTALLTNAHHQFLEPVLEASHISSLFDNIVLSSKVGLVKPDPKIFEYTIQQLGVEPDEAVFIDDMVQNTNAANRLQIHSIVYDDFESCKKQLDNLLTNTD